MQAPYPMARMTFRHTVALLLMAVTCVLVAPAQNTKENADFKLALNLYNDRLYDLAAEQLKQFIAGYPATAQSIEARFYLGLAQLKLNQFEDARLSFQTFALTYQDNPRAPEAWWNVGEAYTALGNTKEAALAFERVKVFHPKHKSAPDALVRAAGLFRACGERDNARRLLRVVLQEFPASAAVLSARTQLGQIYFEDGNLDLAQNELKRVIDGDPSPDAKAQALLILANIHQTMGRSEQAVSLYEEIIAKHKGSSAVQGAYLQHARLDLLGGNHRAAIDNIKKSLAMTKNVDSSLTREGLAVLGDAHVVAGEFAEGAHAYERFVIAAPRDERVQAILWKEALALANGKSFRKSDDVCTRLLKSDAAGSIKRGALLRLGQNAQEQQHAASAMQWYEQFTEQFSDDPAVPEVLYRMGSLAETHMRDDRRAAGFYESVVNRFPRAPLVADAHFASARCYDHLREYERALATYRDALQVYAASERRFDARERVRMIETFEHKNKDAGLEKLAMLVGDVVAEKDRGGLAFRLGEIYFHDLKNYDAAVAQFQNAIATGGTEPQLTQAYFLRARSLEFLSWKEPQRKQEAVDAYDAFAHHASGDARCEEAALSLFLMNTGTLQEARNAYASSVALCPTKSRHDTILLHIGRLQLKADSTSGAFATFTELIRLFPQSPSSEEARYHITKLLFASGQGDSANREAVRFVNDYPKGEWTPVVLYALAELAVKQGRPQSSIEFLQRILSEFFYTDAAPRALQLLAEAYLAGEQNAEAIAAYHELIEQQRSHIGATADPDLSLLLGLGKAYTRQGDFASARKYLFALLARERTGERAAEAYTTLGMIARAEKSTDLASSYFRQATAASPTTSASSDVAGILFENGQYADAIRQYQSLLQGTPDPAQRKLYASRVIVGLLRSDQLARADQEIGRFRETYQEEDEDLALFELEKGEYLFRQKDYPRAVKSFETVTSRYDKSSSVPAAMFWIGKIYEATSRPQEAITQLTTVVQQYPQAAITQKAHLTLGNISYQMERWDAAIKNYRFLVDSTTTDPALLPFAMSNLIETYETAGANDAALALTRRYLELFPNAEDSFDKRIKIGILYQRLGYYDQSVLHLQALLDEAGSDLEGEIRYYVGEANYAKGDYQQAILDFLKVPYLVTKKGKIDWTANALYMSGQAYEKMGRHEQALTMYKQILERSGIDETFRAGARKEIDRVNLVLKRNGK
jgi:TolA-binding protein